MALSLHEVGQMRALMAQYLPIQQINAVLREIGAFPTQDSVGTFTNIRQIEQQVQFEFGWLFKEAILDITVGRELNTTIVPLSHVTYVNKKLTNGTIRLEIWTALSHPTLLYESTAEANHKILEGFSRSLFQLLGLKEQVI